MQSFHITPELFRQTAMQARPDTRGWFGQYGGRFVPETLMPALAELEEVFLTALHDDAFLKTWFSLLENYVGRATPLTYAKNLSQLVNAQVYLKREDLNHTGAHKINNTLAQGLLCQRMGKKRIIAETGAGQHGVASATAAAVLGLDCTVYMGEEDTHRQQLNVFRMKLMGTQVEAVTSGTKTLKDATNEAMRQWVTRVRDTHYIIGSAVGPHPFPWMVRTFQSIIGLETIQQCKTLGIGQPDYVVACVGGGSNSLGMLHPFRGSKTILVGVEAAGDGLATKRHGASLALGKRGILHGSMSSILTTDDGQIQPAHSISAGLDYPGVGPELAYMKDNQEAQFAAVTDQEALAALQIFSQQEGIIPALESAHAIAWVLKKSWPNQTQPTIVINISGRGDKDVQQVAAILGNLT